MERIFKVFANDGRLEIMKILYETEFDVFLNPSDIKAKLKVKKI